MKLVFLTIGHKSPSWLKEMSEDYLQKLSYWVKPEFVVLKPSKLDRDFSDRKKKEESSALVDYLKVDDFVMLLDETGKSLSSFHFSERLNTILQGGKKRLLVVVGGSYGVGEDLEARADLKISLSSFTLNHHVAMAVILEQMYRAFTILKGIKYHNG